MNRRYFVLGTADTAALTAVKKIAGSPNDRIRMACVGVRGSRIKNIVDELGHL